MTNLERWRLYHEQIASPQSYIDMGFYYTISAALQRRVWLGDKEKPIFPNLYVILVGEAGVGKGMVISTVADILRHHEIKTQEKVETKPDKREEGAVDAALSGLLNKLGDKDSARGEKPLLIPVAADATTYEALVKSIARSTRLVSFRNGENKTEYYSHCSVCFALEEISSLFRKHTEDVVNFLLVTYDCRDYTYDTKHQGKDVVRRCCVNLFGGTTPSFMQRVFSDEILTEGFASRTIFVYESKNRFTTLFIPKFTPEQLEAKKQILDHIKALTAIYGQVKIEPDAVSFLDNIWQKEDRGFDRANPSPKLNVYYARKNLHLIKMAMACHFAENIDMTITLKDAEQAHDILQNIEKSMHVAVTLDNKNPLTSVARGIVNHLKKSGPQPQMDLMFEFWGSIPSGKAGYDEIIDMLEKSNKIKRSIDKRLGPIVSVVDEAVPI